MTSFVAKLAAPAAPRGVRPGLTRSLTTLATRTAGSMRAAHAYDRTRDAAAGRQLLEGTGSGMYRTVA